MKFKKGSSGNPAGKPRGAKDRRTELRELLRPHQDELITTVVALAKSGDSTALKIVFDRLMPPLRARDEVVQFAMTGDTLTENARCVLAAIAGGAITPEQGARLLDAVSACARIRAIEESIAGVNHGAPSHGDILAGLSEEELYNIANGIWPGQEGTDPTRRVRELLSESKSQPALGEASAPAPGATPATTVDDTTRPLSRDDQMRAGIQAYLDEPDFEY